MRKKASLLRNRLLWSIFGPKTLLSQISPRRESVLRHVPCHRVLSKTNLDVNWNVFELIHGMTHTWFVTHGTLQKSNLFPRRPISTVFLSGNVHWEQKPGLKSGRGFTVTCSQIWNVPKTRKMKYNGLTPNMHDESQRHACQSQYMLMNHDAHVKRNWRPEESTITDKRNRSPCSTLSDKVNSYRNSKTKKNTPQSVEE
jgi:hypothetical protein